MSCDSSLQEKINTFKQRLEKLLLDDTASPEIILKASQDLDDLIYEYYCQKNIVTER